MLVTEKALEAMDLRHNEVDGVAQLRR